MDLTESEEIKKRWQEYTEELYKNDLNDPDNHDDFVITHLEPDILVLSLFTFMHWRRKWQPTPVFLLGESQGRGSLVGYL